MGIKKYLLPVMLAALMALPSVALAWSSDTTVNTPIAVAPDDQEHAAMVEDGAGGAVIIWTDSRNLNDRNIYAQRVDATGAVQWTLNGVPVCTAAGDQYGHKIVSDGSGGAIIAWQDKRLGTSISDRRIYVQRINGDGVVQWTANGVLVAGSLDSSLHLDIDTDGTGGAVMVWEDLSSNNVSNLNIYAQRIDASGVIQWTAGGIPISALATQERYPSIASDGSGGAIFAWSDGRNGGRAYVQRVNSSGEFQWDASGVPIVGDPDMTEGGVDLAGDGAGGALVLIMATANTREFFVQRVNADGETLWPQAANIASYYPLTYERFMFTGDGLGGAILIWDFQTYVDPNGLDIYAQGVDADGVLKWDAGGIFLGSRPYNSDPISIVSDNAGGFIGSWMVADENYSTDIYAQHYNTAGLPQWGVSPVQVCSNSASQVFPVPVGDGAGGAIFVWQDRRNGEDNDDLYAHRISADGSSSGIQTPANVSPDSGTHVDAAPTLTASAFIDDAALLNHAASQWRIHSINNVTPETPEHATTGDDDYFTYQLPFSFPFFERNISSISVNTNGLIELLEDGETDYASDRHGTHSDGEHIGNMDAIFAANDDLDLINGYLRLYNAGTHVAIEWYGDTYLDADADPNYPDVTNSLLFQVVLHQGGRIVWNFSQLGFTLFDYDMFSGVYPNGGTEISMISGSLADITTPSAFEFNPVTRAITPSTYNWFVPQPVIYDSGEITDLLSHLVPGTVALEDAMTYYWGVRYKGDNNEWSLWSTPTSFTVDLLPPTVTSTEPEIDANDVAVNTVVRATFSEEMAAGTIDTSSFTLSGPEGSVSGTVGYAATVASLTPDVDLDFNTTYTATITLDLTDTTGKPMAAPHIWSFTTGTESDVTLPWVITVVPAVDAMDIAIDIGAISVTFSEPMNESMINQDSFTLTSPDGDVAGTWSYEAQSNTARIDPDALLAYSTSYTVTLTSDIQDNAGNGLATEYSWIFTTVGEPPPPPPEDLIPPRVVSATPLLSPVPASIEAITVTFSEPIQNIDTASFIVRGSEMTISGTVQYDETAMTAWFYPTTDLAFDTQYTVTIISTLIRDLAGNVMEQDYIWFFTIGGDPAQAGCEPELGQEEGCENFDYFTYGTGVEVNTYGSSIAGLTAEDAARRSVSFEESLSEDLVDTSSFESQAIARVDNTDFSLRSRSKRIESTSDRAGAWSIGASKITVNGVPPGTAIPMSIVVSGNFTGPTGTLLLQVRDFDNYRMLGSVSVTGSGNPFTYNGQTFEAITYNQMIDPYGSINDASNYVKTTANGSNGFRLDFPYAVIPNNGIYVWFVAGVISNDGITTGETDFTARLEVNPPPGVTVTLASGQVFTGAVDTDGDGVSDLEDSSPNDATIASPETVTGNGNITVDASGNAGVTLSQVRVLDDDDVSLIQDGKPTDQQFPDGLVSFRINGLALGATAQVNLTFPTDLPSDAKYYKVHQNGFYEFTNISINGNTVTLNLVDGGSGDADNVANGVILDPGGISLTVAGEDSGGGGGSSGCFVSTISP